METTTLGSYKQRKRRSRVTSSLPPTMHECLLKPRIQKLVEEAGGISIRQHGFKPKRSILGPTKDVIEGVKTAQSGTH